ncbi:hypothetical protein HPB48_016208 [Haemaphysalis longicornis]|uniref:Ubiquitin-conjugating enzyme E2 Z n=1 Tax=Haemaphysalis longicornis TaxID=44386 RepID=A0A9J6FUZ7_HAELO|nr:hypothetical protein HPB48_016208 [Haemaphysalis longicornis]
MCPGSTRERSQSLLGCDHCFLPTQPRDIHVRSSSLHLLQINGLLVGSFDTPYEGGFFHVILKCPPDYPLAPPRVRFLTTDQGRVQFNPHFFPSGNICLSILG